MISQERIEELESYFWDETNDEDTQEWRNDLDEEEEKLVDKWEKQYWGGYIRLCTELAERINSK
jgi:hypothetical protein